MESANAMSQWVGQAGSRVLMSLIAIPDRSDLGSFRIDNNSLKRSLVGAIRLPRGGLSRWAGGTTRLVIGLDTMRFAGMKGADEITFLGLFLLHC